MHVQFKRLAKKANRFISMLLTFILVLGVVPTKPVFAAPSIIVTTTVAKDITETDAVVCGSVSKSSNVKIESIGIYFGTSESNMVKATTESVSAKTNNVRNGQGFDIWYGLNKWGQSLSPETTYYWQCYAIYNGQEYKGSIQSFTTKIVPINPNITVTTTVAKDITQNDAVVYGSVSKSSNVKIETIGIYFGTSESNMVKVSTESVSDITNGVSSGQGFDIWYGLNKWGQSLSSGTTYYWQCYAISNGIEYKGSVQNFTTIGDINTNYYVVEIKKLIANNLSGIARYDINLSNLDISNDIKNETYYKAVQCILELTGVKYISAYSEDDKILYLVKGLVSKDIPLYATSAHNIVYFLEAYKDLDSLRKKTEQSNLLSKMPFNKTYNDIIDKNKKEELAYIKDNMLSLQYQMLNNTVIRNEGYETVSIIADSLENNEILSYTYINQLCNTLKNRDDDTKFWFSQNEKLEKYDTIEKVGQLMSMILDFTPLLGDAKGFKEAWTGKDAITGETLGWFEIALNVMALSELKNLGKLANTADNIRNFDKALSLTKEEIKASKPLKPSEVAKLIDGAGGKLDPTISKKINKALSSTNPDIKLEGDVATALGDDVVSFQRKIDTPTGRIGEIDVETSKYIVEVTNGASSKTASEFQKYFEKAMNPNGKGVVLYAPNLNATKITDIENAGVKVIQSIEELLKFLSK